MAYNSGLLVTPAICPVSSPSTKGTNGGQYDGVSGKDLEKRTKSSSAVPEKTFEPNPKGAEVNVK